MLTSTRNPKNLFGLAILLGFVSGVGGPVGADVSTDWRFRAHQSIRGLDLPLVPGPTDLLRLDDNSAEGEFGVGAAAARQFMWFNHFSPLGIRSLEQIWVLFPADPSIQVGDPIDLVVYRDTNGDPTDGAEFVLLIHETVQHRDGAAFSVYIVDPPVSTEGADVYLGVIPRFIVSGVTPTTLPAALDTSSSAQRSWVAVWTGDPPSTPMLPSDDHLGRIDDVVSGNWMIRGVASQGTIVDVPVLDVRNLGLLAIVLAVAGILRIRSRRLHAMDQ